MSYEKILQKTDDSKELFEKILKVSISEAVKIFPKTPFQSISSKDGRIDEETRKKLEPQFKKTQKFREAVDEAAKLIRDRIAHTIKNNLAQHIKLSTNQQQAFTEVSAIFFDLIDSKVADILSKKNDYQDGNCGERATSAFFATINQLRKYKIDSKVEMLTIEVFGRNEGHQLFVLNRDTNKQLNEHPSKWGKNCYICDAAKEEFYNVDSIPTNSALLPSKGGMQLILTSRFSNKSPAINKLHPKLQAHFRNLWVNILYADSFDEIYRFLNEFEASIKKEAISTKISPSINLNEVLQSIINEFKMVNDEHSTRYLTALQLAVDNKIDEAFQELAKQEIILPASKEKSLVNMGLLICKNLPSSNPLKKELLPPLKAYLETLTIENNNLKVGMSKP